MKLAHEYNFGSDKGRGLRAEDRIPASGQLVFDPNYSEVKKVIVEFDKAKDSISVAFKAGCTVALKRTTDQTLPSDFKGKRALHPIAELSS
jgi:hypothetical protein